MSTIKQIISKHISFSINHNLKTEQADTKKFAQFKKQKW